MELKTSTTPHILIIPFPLQGHVNPMLNLAEILCFTGFNVTFLSSTHIHRLLTRYTGFETRFSHYPSFVFKAISDGLPDDHLRTGEDGAKDVCAGFKLNLEPILREILGYAINPVTCLVVDGWLSVAHDLANAAEIPVMVFRCFSACCTWVYFCIPGLIEAGEIPFKDGEDNMDELVQNAEWLNKFLRYRDLPRFCRDKQDTSSCLELQQSFAEEIQRTKKTHALILNTCEDLEGPLLDLIRSHCPSVYSIGPLHAHLRAQLNQDSSSGLGELDKSCKSWLDQKADKSVLYVSFGSITMLEREQLIEIWAGLVQSQCYFLWAVRPNLIIGTNSDELVSGTAERGYIVGWVPQEDVLAHPSVGGFLTHSGWNSTLESITAEVPMLCWPYFGDQQVNSRYVSEVWRVGLDMKDTCDRNVVAKMVGELMHGRKDELQRSVARLSGLVRSVIEEGSSYCNLDSLIQDIKQMTTKNVKQIRPSTEGV